MNIIDSSFWIEYFIDGKNANLIEKQINDSENLLVPTVILSEVFKWVLREKGEMEAISALAAMKSGRIIDLTEEIAINASYFGLKFKLAFADSLIYSSCQIFEADLYTLDSHLKNLPNVHFFEKII